MGAMCKVSSKFGKNENNTDVSIYKINLPKYHENI